MYRDRKTLQVSQEMRDVAEKVLADTKIDLDMAQIEYVLVYPNISKTKVGKTQVANHELSFFSGADYLVKISGEVWDALDADRKYNLVWHFIEQINPEYNEKRGEFNFKTRNYDVTGFRRIIDKSGIDWFDGIKEIVASIYDLEPGQKDKITA